MDIFLSLVPPPPSSRALGGSEVESAFFLPNPILTPLHFTFNGLGPELDVTEPAECDGTRAGGIDWNARCSFVSNMLTRSFVDLERWWVGRGFGYWGEEVLRSEMGEGDSNWGSWLDIMRRLGGADGSLGGGRGAKDVEGSELLLLYDSGS